MPMDVNCATPNFNLSNLYAPTELPRCGVMNKWQKQLFTCSVK